MKNFTKTLAAVAIITLASGTESAFAHRLTSEDTADNLPRVESTSDIAISMPHFIVDKSFDVEIHETEASDIAISMPHFIVDKSFDVEIHETEASDIAISMPHYIVVPHFIVDKSFDVEIHKTEASDKA